MTDKPSRNEDEYFAREEREKLERHRTEARHAALSAERKTHFMKCPKCGADLMTETLHGIQIERCPEDNGIWLDAGELDALAAHEDHGVIGRIFGDVMSTFRRSKPK
jgi:Zn-finger nucleic acid-binding protein